jgi:hypothetical protein
MIGRPSGRLLALSLAALSAVGVPVTGAGAQDGAVFKGKTVTLLVGSEPGGGTDASARLVAPYLRKYLPGQPNVIVQNMPGASGVTALNFFTHRVQPDGLTVIMGSISMIDPIIFRRSTSQYDPKSLGFAGGIGRGGSVIFINKEAEPRLHDKSAKPVVIGSILAVPRSVLQPALWCIEYLGWNAAWVTGYHGTNEVMLALDRGEVDMTSTGNIFQIQQRVNSGQLKIVLQTGGLENGKVVPRADFGDAPLFPDMMQGKITDPVAQKAFDYWMALNAGDKWLALPPGSPEPMLAAYREAFKKVTADKELLEHSESISEGFTPMSPGDVEMIARTLADTPPEALDYAKALMRKQGIRIQ